MLQHMMSTPMELRPKLVQLYWRAMQRGQWRRFFACLLRRDCRLEMLRRNAESHAAAARAYVGLKEVPLDAMCGTEEQAPAFDRDFHPIGERPRQRWLSIAEARLQGKPIRWLSKTCKKVVEDAKVAKFTPHDLRRTAATKMRQLKISREVVSKILNHTPQDVTSLHYDHYELLAERSEALQTWGNYIDTLVKSPVEALSRTAA